MTSSWVLDLQQEVQGSDCDVLHTLRKAHLIATKLKLIDCSVPIRVGLSVYLGESNRKGGETKWQRS